MLVLQTVLLPLLMAPGASRIIISGGTHNPAAPPYQFIEKSFLPVLRQMGGDVELSLLNYGFMPAGGGKVMAVTTPGDGLRRIDLGERGARLDLFAEAYFANLPLDVAERELAQVGARLSLPQAAMKVREVNSIGPGNMLAVTARFEHVTEVVAAFGRRGVKAEDVADEVAERTTAYLDSGVAVGPHLADQLLLPMALAGGGSFTTVEPTAHTMTNASIIEKFLDIDISFESRGPAGGVTVTLG
jgi:RNA 3'-terminal phosphate cyclase (ATP)